MPKYYGILELHLNEFTADNPEQADKLAEEYKNKLAEVSGMAWEDWDFRLTWADSSPNTEKGA
jgi:hypothetical protein